MRVVLDTNVVVSAVLSPTGSPAEVVRRWRREAFDVVVSEAMLDEYRRALGYPKVRALHGLDDARLDQRIARLRRLALLVEPTRVVTAVEEDLADNRVLECAVAGEAAYVVSGDRRHLLSLKSFEGIRILSPGAFLAVLDADEAPQ